MSKSMKPGGGGRFQKLVSGLKKKGKSEKDSKAIAASIGRKKYGDTQMNKRSSAARKKY